MNIYGITYAKPQVVLLQQTGIGVAEVAARTCYDSFENSENDAVRTTQSMLPDLATCQAINEIEESNLLDDLAWTYFHHSILEHANLSYLVRGTSRGVLQEHARHRIQAISVRSTRYTMSSI
ncbi:MAG: FAD-dependent thymidylate synthase, partial [Campylobacterales bacterium]|nr:FAD-dependent thymidylate synthase [Campylobacterales bacterium]